MERRKGVLLSIQKWLVQSGGVGASSSYPSPHQGSAAVMRHAAGGADRGDRPPAHSYRVHHPAVTVGRIQNLGSNRDGSSTKFPTDG